MLKNQPTHPSPIAGLVMEAARGNAVTTLLSDTAHRIVMAVQKANEDRKCRKLIRETKETIAKLDDVTLRDIGWPGRYENQNPCIRDKF